jgi:hypothetical protein
MVVWLGKKTTPRKEDEFIIWKEVVRASTAVKLRIRYAKIFFIPGKLKYPE